MVKDREIDRAILGLLAHEDLTGYDIKKRIDGAIRYFWKGSFGSISPALSDTEQCGQEEKAPCDSAGGRERIVYHITGAGKSALRDWLYEEQASNELKYETLLKLFFGGAAPREVTVRNIEVFERKVSEDLAVLRLYEADLASHLDEEDHLYCYLTVTFGIETFEAYLRWCEKARKALGAM